VHQECAPRSRQRSPLSRISSAWTLRVSLLAVACSGCSKQKETSAEKEGAQIRAVRLSAVEHRGIERTIEVSGTLAADEQVTVAAKVPGRIASVAVDLASPVKTGDVIAQIEATDFRLRVDQMAAAVSQARVQLGLAPDGADDTVDPDSTAIVRQALATLEEARAARTRAEALARDGLSSAAEKESADAAFLRAETAVQSAREEVRMRLATLRQRRSEARLAQQQLADTTLKSPITGVVQARRANTGEFVSAGAPIADIVRIDPLRLKLVIPEREATNVEAGQAVKVTVEGDTALHTGTIARVAPALDAQNRTLLVEADIKNPGTLRPGVLASAQVILGSKPALTVPSSAIVVFAGIQKVITIEADKAVEKRVTTGKRVGNVTEILTGVGAGDRVVREPGSLQQGQAVRVVEGP
jgi:RND family efflux transporter MFP subunit